MRVAEGRYHTAEVCGDILHNKREGHIFLLARAVQREKAEGQKRDKRHIVCNQHRADKRDIDKRDDAKAGIFAKLYYLACKYREKAYVTQSADHRKHGKKTGKRFEIEISEVSGIGRHDKRGYQSRSDGYEQNRVVLCEIRYCREDIFF